MEVVQLAPSDALAPFVRTFEIVEADAAMVRTLVPEVGLVIGFRYAGSSALIEGGARTEVPRRALTGLRTTVRRMLTPAGSGIVLAKLRTGGAAALLDGPLHRLFGRTLPLDELVDARELDAVSSAIASAPSHRGKVDALEGFLLHQRARSRWAPDRAVTATLRAVDEDPRSLRVGALARRLGMSVDALEKRFRRGVGCTPKQLASIVRLRRAIGSHRAGTSLARLALDAGYYDQSHFVRQLVAAAGAPPRAFFDADEHCMT